MISKLKRVIVIFLSVIMSFNISVISPFAASKSSERKSSAYWASADSGWSSMDYWLKYEEIYTASGSNNIFSSRTRLYAYNTVAAVNVPYMQLGNVLHKDSGLHLIQSLLFGIRHILRKVSKKIRLQKHIPKLRQIRVHGWYCLFARVC